MERIGVRQLQQNASEALRRVRRGERLEITDRGRPVAVLSPADAASILDALEAAGRLTRAQEDLLDAPGPVRPATRAERPSRRLARLRASER
jgi:prevent-host-death family protein